MRSELEMFEGVVRRAQRFTDAAPKESSGHPFEARNVHSDLPPVVRRLFDNGHYAQATFEAFKFVDQEVRRISGEKGYGTNLMMRVFGGGPPKIALNAGVSPSDQDEQEGYKFLFAGATLALRNPRGHVSGLADGVDDCLDHLALASLLLRRLDQTGLRSASAAAPRLSPAGRRRKTVSTPSGSGLS